MTANVRDRPKACAAYDADFSLWLNEQAALIRTGRFAEVDADNVGEELEGMARSEFRSLVSALRVLIMHMLKWDVQPERRTSSWATSIREQRFVYADVIDDNPSFNARREEARVKAYRGARVAAISETGLSAELFPMACPYDWDDLLTRPFEADSAPPSR